MALAGLGVEGLFALLHLTPTRAPAAALAPVFAWNATTWLDVGAIAIVAVLGWRFLTTGGPAMLKAMDAPVDHAPCAHAGRRKGG